MQIEVTELFKVVTPEEGKMLYNGDVYSELVYTPLTIDPEDYWQEVNIEDIPEEPEIPELMDDIPPEPIIEFPLPEELSE